MAWYDEFNATFWITISTMVVGLAGLLLKYGFASKCDNVQLCCGIIKIHRAVEYETTLSDTPPEAEIIQHDSNNDNV